MDAVHLHTSIPYTVYTIHPREEPLAATVPPWSDAWRETSDVVPGLGVVPCRGSSPGSVRRFALLWVPEGSAYPGVMGRRRFSLPPFRFRLGGDAWMRRRRRLMDAPAHRRVGQRPRRSPPGPHPPNRGRVRVFVSPTHRSHAGHLSPAASGHQGGGTVGRVLRPAVDAEGRVGRAGGDAGS